jgi:recombination protein RecA
MKRDQRPKLSEQMTRRAEKPLLRRRKELDGNVKHMTSTGSTLLDLAISGTRVRGGGLPSGIMIEIFGPSSSGKTVLLTEIAGAIQRGGGEVLFNDPEARLSKSFAEVFDLKTKDMQYETPDTVTEIFTAARKWKPQGKGIHGIFSDSLAALSTDLEMGKDEGDKMGGRRAKEFSEGFRKFCRVLAQKNYLMVCSNQVRQNVGGGDFEPKYKTPGGEATGFYSCLRLRTHNPQKKFKEIVWRGKEKKEVEGIRTTVEVFKSSIDKPHRKAPVYIIFDYGIDDIRENLQFVKDNTKHKIYTVDGQNLDNSMEKSIRIVEQNKWEKKLREEVIDLWERIQKEFETDRKPKER